MNDESVEIANRYSAWMVIVFGILFSIFTGIFAWGTYTSKGERPVPRRELTAALLALFSVIFPLIMYSSVSVFSSAKVCGKVLTIRKKRRKWEIPVEQVTSVERIAYPFRGVYALRLVFDERSPIRDAILDVSWLEEQPVGSIEDLIEQAKRWTERNAPYRPAS